MPHLGSVLLLGCLLFAGVKWQAVLPANAAATGVSEGQCRNQCFVCQSLTPAHINQLCSATQLAGCGCQEFALNLTMAATAASAVPGDAATTGSGNCPVTEAVSRVGFCPFGQRTELATGCPLGVCRPAPGCQQDSNSRPLRDCRAYCPAGYATDADGCPLCLCRCEDAEAFDRRCAAECAAAGAAHEIRPPATQGQGCPLCLCRTTSVVAATQSPAAVQPQQQPCLLRCPNSCGAYGYADAESRDDRGCVKDCSCNCPGRLSCPNGDRCLRWEIDRFGCQVCETCTSGRQPAGDSSCITKAVLDATPAGQQGALIAAICPWACAQGSSYLIATATSPSSASSPCLSCTCQPLKAATSAPHRQPPACRGFSLDACLADCPSGNATVAKDSNGCYACRCADAAQAEPGVGDPLPANCPLAESRALRCSSKSCGTRGFETDPLTGCQRSCRCACPKRPAGGCGCFFGSRQDEYGCETCQCVTASEYMSFLPF